MKKYGVRFTMEIDCLVDIEAENESEARQKVESYGLEDVDSTEITYEEVDSKSIVTYEE
jgi:hypothetical protein